MDRRRALAVGSAQTVRAGVATTDDHHPFAKRADAGCRAITFLHAISKRQVLHRLVNTVQLATRNRQIAPRRRTPG